MQILESIDEKLGRLVDYITVQAEPERVVVGSEGGKVAWMRIEDVLRQITAYEFILKSGGRLEMYDVLNNLKEILTTGGRGDV